MFYICFPSFVGNEVDMRMGNENVSLELFFNTHTRTHIEFISDKQTKKETKKKKTTNQM